MRRLAPGCEPRVMETVLNSLEMMGLALVSVSLWTLRVALTARGRKVAGSITAGLEALVFLLVFSRAAADLQAVERLVGYAFGVALGALAGMMLDERLSTGQSEVRVVSEGRDTSLVRSLQKDGWPVTSLPGQGPEGDVTVAFVALDDARLPGFVKHLAQVAPESFWTVERLNTARAGRVHPGWIQVHGLHRGRWPGLRQQHRSNTGGPISSRNSGST
jgi:uncharacterized protein YebE (UPF0316 family)